MMFRRFVFFACLLALFLSFPQPGIADSNNGKTFTNNPVVATVDGEPIMMDDVKNAQIHDAMAQLHKMQNRALKEKILQILGKKYPEIIDEEPPEVRESDVAKFYRETPGVKDLGSLESMREEIREYLERVSHATYIEKKYQWALENKLVKVYLKPPSDFHVVAGIGTAMLAFDPEPKKSRKVFVLEYSDFECPFCKRVQDTLRKLRKEYAKDVQFGYRHFPLPFHKGAKYLAEAVECARDQERFWQMQRILYEKVDNTSPLAGKEVVALAKDAGVKKLDAFQSCLKTGKYKERVQNDVREGLRLGIQGTPTFILGLYDSESGNVSGEMFSGAVSQEKFIEAIEKYLSLSRAEAKLIR